MFLVREICGYYLIGGLQYKAWVLTKGVVMKSIAKIGLVSSLVVGVCLFSAAGAATHNGENHAQAAPIAPKPWVPQKVTGPTTPTLSSNFQSLVNASDVSSDFKAAFQHATAKQIAEAQVLLNIQSVMAELRVNGHHDVESQVYTNLTKLSSQKGPAEVAYNNLTKAISALTSALDQKLSPTQHASVEQQLAKANALLPGVKGTLDNINSELAHQKSVLSKVDSIVEGRLYQLTQSEGALTSLTSQQKAVLIPKTTSGIVELQTGGNSQIISQGLVQTPQYVIMANNVAHEIANEPVTLSSTSEAVPRMPSMESIASQQPDMVMRQS
jgi:hypothetical protein